MGASQLRSPVEMRRRSDEETPGTNGAGGVGPAGKPIPEEILEPGPDSDDNTISILSGGEESVIDLDEGITFPSQARYLLVADGTRTFTWHVDKSVEVKQIQWQHDNFTLGAASNRDVIASAQLIETGAGAGPPEYKSNKPFFQVSRDEGNSQMHAELHVSEFNQSPNLTAFLRGRMTILIDWETDVAYGWTMSGIFTVVENSSQGEQWASENFRADDSEEVKREKQHGKVRTDSKETKMRYASSSGLVASSATSSVPPLQDQTSIPSAAAADGSPNSGLSTGVIAGIAVGAAAFFIILITAIFLLYRRRHRKRQAAEQAGYDSQQNATVYFADKETSRLPETPPTPYSEDGGHRLPLNDVPGAPVAQQRQSHDHVEHDQHSHLRNTSDSNNTTFMPYKNPEPATSRTDLAMRSGTVTPLGVSANIAHLVEDGMTEADLRRLEEEERQLDDAIAQARRR